MECNFITVIHPGLFLKEDVLEANNISVTKAAELLGVTRVNLSNIINEKIDITANMAIRISKVFGGTPDVWLKLQMRYNLNKAIINLKDLKLKALKDIEVQQSIID